METRNLSMGSTPQQTTDEVGHWSEPVTEFHAAVADAMLEYVYLTSDYTRGLLMLDFTSKFAPTPDSLIQEKTEDGWYKVKGGLPPKEYAKLVGQQQWASIELKYADEKYKVYDDEQEKDPATQLYPEFELMFKDGCYIKVDWSRYKDDNQPKLQLQFKSHKEYISK